MDISQLCADFAVAVEKYAAQQNITVEEAAETIAAVLVNHAKVMGFIGGKH